MNTKDLEIKLASPEVDDEFTGERFIPSLSGELAWEHLHRYAVALDPCRGLDVLDIASGEGYGSYMLSQVAKSVVGVDIDPASIEKASTRYASSNLKFLVGDCGAIPLAGHSVDVVVSFETIEHISKPEELLKEICRVLKPDGLLILSSPDKDFYRPEGSEQNPFHLHEMSEEDLFGNLKERFKNVKLFRQRCIFGSAILPLEAEPLAPQVFESSNGRLTRLQCVTNSPYLFAVCSNGAISNGVPSSFFDSGLSSNALSALQGGIQERDDHIRMMVEREVVAHRKLGALEGGIEERDARIREGLATIAKLQMELGALRDGITERDEKFQALLEQFVESQRLVGAYRGGVEERDIKIRDLLDQLSSRQGT